ncbi:hypothetical protein VCSRO83_3681 [Vibrio cholerae]|nr:hypothetical protein VCSRO83_3681 [Vibrio cholerae]
MLEIIQITSDEEVQYSAFSSYMDSLLRNEVWRSGNISNKRIPWSEGLAARKQDIDIFNSFGIYIWGGIQAPIYVGKRLLASKSDSLVTYGVKILNVISLKIMDQK